jgi:hypothetical protein
LTIQLQLPLLLEKILRMRANDETVKHVTVKVKFLQECVQRGIIMIAYIKTCKNIADIMTKQSVAPQFTQHRDYTLGIIDAINTVVAELAITHGWRKIRFCV